MMKASNLRAAMEGAENPAWGGYLTFKPVTLIKVNQFLGQLLLNGCHPKPQVDQWVLSSLQCPMFRTNIGPHIFMLGVWKYREFKRFFCLYDAQAHPTMSVAHDTLF